MGTTPILVVDGQGFDLFVLATNPKSGKTYWQPKSASQSAGQTYKYGVSVDAEVFPRGVNSDVGIIDDTGKVVPLKPTLGLNKAKEQVVRWTADLMLNGEKFHVDQQSTGLSQKGDGKMNLRFNIIKGHNADLSEARKAAAEKAAEGRKVVATKVAVPA